MKRSIYKGHSIEGDELKFINESKRKQENLSGNNSLDEKVKALVKFGIVDWEQLYSLLVNDSIRNLVKTAINLDTDEELETLKEVSEKVLPHKRLQALNDTEFLNCPLGARKPEKIETHTEKFAMNEHNEIELYLDSIKKLDEVKAFDNISNYNLADSVNHIHHLNPIKSQGQDRGTCTAFAVTAANEFAIFTRTGIYHDLSEQHLFYATKVLEGDTVCGSWVKSSMQIIAERGQCTESTWAYNPNLPCVQQYGIPSNAANNAMLFRTTYFIINQNDVSALKQVISSGRIIPFSIPIYDSWYKSSEAYRTGRITLPLPGEGESGAHSMAIVGYQDDVNSPGGGYFIIRNSWGTDWARDSYYGAGYGVIPYQYIAQYNWEAYAF